MYTGFATQVWSCGGRDFEPDGRAVFADAQAVAATAAFIHALRDAGPVDWTDQRWHELALDFGRGRYALLVDSDHYVAFFEDERQSELVGRIGYALPPAGPAGERRPNLWTWSVAMTAASRDKRAARDFITWAASKPFLLRSAGEGNMNPTRASTWDDPAFQALTAPWDEFAAVSRRLLDDYATVLVTPTPHYREIALRWTEALREAYHGRDVAEALRAAATEAEQRFAARDRARGGSDTAGLPARAANAIQCPTATASPSSPLTTFAPRSPGRASRGGPPRCCPNRRANGTGTPASPTRNAPNSRSCATPSPNSASSSTSSGAPATPQPPKRKRSATRSARSRPAAPGNAAEPSRSCAPAVCSTLRPPARQ